MPRHGDEWLNGGRFAYPVDVILRIILILGLAAGTACSDKPDDTGKTSVVASFFPVAEAGTKVGGDFVAVTNLTPAGVEPHDLELTSEDVDRIEDAGALFYVGSGFQPGVATAAARREGVTVDVAAGLIDAADDDPHFWLDPKLMVQAVDRVQAGLAKADPAHADAFMANAASYKRQLTTLDADYASTLATCARREIVTAHAAFSRLAARYGLVQHAITGVTPDAEPSPQRLAELSDLIKRNHVTTVFYEELVPRDFADTLAKDAGVKAAVLSPIEGLTEKQARAGGSYVSVMRSNLAALSAALDCSGGSR